MSTSDSIVEQRRREDEAQPRVPNPLRIDAWENAVGRGKDFYTGEDGDALPVGTVVLLDGHLYRVTDAWTTTTPPTPGAALGPYGRRFRGYRCVPGTAPVMAGLCRRGDPSAVVPAGTGIVNATEAAKSLQVAADVMLMAAGAILAHAGGVPPPLHDRMLDPLLTFQRVGVRDVHGLATAAIENANTLRRIADRLDDMPKPAKKE